MKRNNLLILSYYISKGGGETYLEKLANNIKQKKNVIVITNKSKNKIKIKLKNEIMMIEKNFSKVFDRKMIFKNIIFVIDLFKIIRKYKIDIIQTNDNYTLFYAFLPSKIAKKPLIFINHSQYPPKYRIYKYIYSKTKLIICVSKWNKANMIEYKKDLKNMIVIPIGFSVDNTNENNREYITYCARYAKIKKIDDFIKIVDIIRRNDILREYKYQIVGGSENDSDYALINESIPKYIEKIGFTENVDYFYARTKVYLNTSKRESFGMTIIEAMMHGIPIVSTRLPTITEFIKNGRNGYLFEIGDVNSAANYILKLLGNNNIYDNIFNNNINDAQKYSIERIGEKYLKVYDKM